MTLKLENKIHHDLKFEYSSHLISQSSAKTSVTPIRSKSSPPSSGHCRKSDNPAKEQTDYSGGR